MKHTTSRRTTLTLPSGCLETAQRIARKRHLTLSAVISEALERGLKEEEQAQRSEAILAAYSTAFAAFSNDDLLLLDGIVAEDAGQQHPGSQKRRVRKPRRRTRK